MPLDNGKLQLPWDLALWMIAVPLNATSLRLLIALLHQQELRAGWSEEAPHAPRCWAPLADLRHRVGPRGANDARAFCRLRAELKAQEIVTWCEFDRLGRQRVLKWQVAPGIAASMAVRTRAAYVLLDLDELGALRTHEEIRLYVHLRRQIGMNAPQFLMQITPERWRADRRRLDRAFERLAGMLHVRFHLGLAYRADRPVPEHLIVKIEHAGTKWFPGAIAKFPPGTERWVIGPPDAMQAHNPEG